MCSEVENVNKRRYFANKAWFENHKGACNALAFLYKFLPYVMVAAVPALIIMKAFMGIDMDFLRMIYIPVFVLILTTVLRKIINKPRPYEVYETTPVIKRNGKGESIPSRHTSSAFIIAMAAIPVSLPLFIALSIIAVIIALTRIFAGVHFISDVIVGALISIVVGLIFFILL